MNKYTLLCMFLFIYTIITYGQKQEVTTRPILTENFVVRAFDYSAVHYFARLSHNNQTIYVKNRVHPEKSLIIFSNFNKGIKTLDFSSDEKYLISGTYAGTIDIWNLDTRDLQNTIQLHNNKSINRVQFLEGTSTFISAANDGKLFLTEIDGKNIKHELIGMHNGIVRDFDISDNIQLAVSIGNDGYVNLWHIHNGKKIRSLQLSENMPSSVKFYSNTNDVLVGCEDGSLYNFTVDLKLKKKTTPHQSVITSINIFSENQIITSSFDGELKNTHFDTFEYNTLYEAESYIINVKTFENLITFSTANRELISIKTY